MDGKEQPSLLFPPLSLIISAFCLCIQLDLFKPLGFKDLNFFLGSMQVQIDSVEKSPKLFQTMQWNQKGWSICEGMKKGGG